MIYCGPAEWLLIFCLIIPVGGDNAVLHTSICRVKKCCSREKCPWGSGSFLPQSDVRTAASRWRGRRLIVLFVRAWKETFNCACRGGFVCREVRSHELKYLIWLFFFFLSIHFVFVCACIQCILISEAGLSLYPGFEKPGFAPWRTQNTVACVWVQTLTTVDFLRRCGLFWVTSGETNMAAVRVEYYWKFRRENASKHWPL